MVRNKVAKACVRCRRQKLRCDEERPCTLCVRGGAECVAIQPQPWQTPYSGQTKGRSLRRKGSVTHGQVTKSGRKPRSPDLNDDNSSPTDDSNGGCTLGNNEPGSSLSEGQTLATSGNDCGGSSSTIGLVEEAFHHHDTASLETAETSALGYSPNTRKSLLSSGLEDLSTHSIGSERQPCQVRASHSAATELMSLLPSRDAVMILVDNYFNKIHWFMLLFHQREFKRSLNDIYDDNDGILQTTTPQNSNTVGYVSVLLAACALSLRYIDTDQRKQLASHGYDSQVLRENILTSLRLRLLEILALGSLEAVQMCVLLSSYYLYHGEPELAWPLSGCALRLAQALELHRRPMSHNAHLASCGDLYQREVQARKRCWWAVHEIDTFCSMIYGFPLSISDSDCDVESLDSRDPWSIAADGQSSLSAEPSLLVYKCSMSALTKIVKSALKDLYGLRKKPHGQSSGPTATSEASSALPSITRKIAVLDAQLAQWYSDLPTKLRLKKFAQPNSTSPSSHNNAQNRSRLQEPRALSFDDQLFQLQALALKLAYENARILIHRPLLSYKVVNSSNPSSDSEPTKRHDSFHVFIQACRDAALQISWAGHTTIFKEASTTYALNFISLHLLTAGVTLCIMTSLSPLSQESFESKMGIRRLMEMQMTLRPTSIVADQGLQILKKLLSLVMKKETDTMLEFGPSSHETTATQYIADRIENTSSTTNHEAPSQCNETPLEDGGQQDDVATVPPGFSSEITTENFNDMGALSSAATIGGASFDLGDLCQDPLTAQAMLDFEQAMVSLNNNSEDQDGRIAPNLDTPTAANSSIGQDPGWMWSSTIDVQWLDWGNNP
ncbi:hypothetical protein F4810DRAFT_726348 [Camillea tinctor]|nr:hypothetical protein F4810DRAFT_726348 [Camillea tinctor]